MHGNEVLVNKIKASDSHESKVQAKNEQVEQMQAKSKRVLTQKHEQQIESEHTRVKGEQVQEKSEQQVQSTQRTRSKQVDVDRTKELIAYLGLLLERQIIGDKELLRLIEGLERDEISNPIHEEDTWVSSAALIHREEIENYIHKTQINPKELYGVVQEKSQRKRTSSSEASRNS